MSSFPVTTVDDSEKLLMLAARRNRLPSVAVAREDMRVNKSTVSATVVGYCRVSTEEQARTGLGLAAQRLAIAGACQVRGWVIVAIEEDEAASGASMSKRDGLRRALERIDRGEASTLVVAKLDRLSRSLLDFAQLMERSRREGWTLIALDLGVDTTTPSGALLANVLASFAEFERRLIGQRTRDALHIRRRSGVALGRPPALSDDVRTRIQGLRATGASYRAIAAILEADSVPRAHGGSRWHAATVRRVLKRDSIRDSDTHAGSA